jgi:hypothetical protein
MCNLLRTQKPIHETIEDQTIYQIIQNTYEHIAIKNKKTYTETIELISTTIKKESCNGKWCCSVYIHNSVKYSVMLYYNKKGFKIFQTGHTTWDDHDKYDISWLQKRRIKKWKAVVNCIIFIRRLQESFLGIDGTFHRRLIEKYD